MEIDTPGHQPSDESRTKLFTLGQDRRWRSAFTPGGFLTVKNMQDTVIFRLKYNRRILGATTKWQIQVPKGKKHRSVGFSDSSKSKSWSTGIDLNIENLVTDGRSIIIHISEPRDDVDSYLATVDGVVVARATRFKAKPKARFSSWQVEVAKGFDLALVRCDHF